MVPIDKPDSEAIRFDLIQATNLAVKFQQRLEIGEPIPKQEIRLLLFALQLLLESISADSAGLESGLFNLHLALDGVADHVCSDNVLSERLGNLVHGLESLLRIEEAFRGQPTFSSGPTQKRMDSARRILAYLSSGEQPAA